MSPEILEDRIMKNLAVFSLPAVVRYDEELLRRYLFDAVHKVEGKDFSHCQIPFEGNASQFIMDLYKSRMGAYPSIDKVEKICKKFTKRVKKYFIDEDDSFEVRPGVQSLFGQIERKKDWKYCIISDYWAEPTHLMLQSCGIFSKNKLTITADDALTRVDQLKIAHKRVSKNHKKKLKIFWVDNHYQLDASDWAITLKPKASSETNYFTYPRFTEFFKTKS